jgi:hypothetical protein
MTRPRVADDFAAIRARIEELRRERAQVSAEEERCGPHPAAHGRRSLLDDKPDSSSYIRRVGRGC